MFRASGVRGKARALWERASILITTMLIMIVIFMMAIAIFKVTTGSSQEVKMFSRDTVLKTALASSAQTVAFMVSSYPAVFVPSTKSNGEPYISLIALNALNNPTFGVEVKEITSDDDYEVTFSHDDSIRVSVRHDAIKRGAILIVTMNVKGFPKNRLHVIYYFPAEHSVGGVCLDTDLTFESVIEKRNDLENSLKNKNCPIFVPASYNNLRGKSVIKNDIRVVQGGVLSLVGLALQEEEREGEELYAPLSLAKFDFISDPGALAAASITGNYTIVVANKWRVASNDPAYHPTVTSSYVAMGVGTSTDGSRKTRFLGEGTRPGRILVPASQDSSQNTDPVDSITKELLSDPERASDLSKLSDILSRFNDQNNKDKRIYLTDYYNNDTGEFFEDLNDKEQEKVQDNIGASRGYKSNIKDIVNDISEGMKASLEEKGLYDYSKFKGVKLPSGLYFFIGKDQVLYFPPKGRGQFYSTEDYYKDMEKAAAIMGYIARKEGKDNLIKTLEEFEKGNITPDDELYRPLKTLYNLNWNAYFSSGSSASEVHLSKLLKKKDKIRLSDGKRDRILFLDGAKVENDYGKAEFKEWKLKVEGRVSFGDDDLDDYENYVYISSAPIVPKNSLDLFLYSLEHNKNYRIYANYRNVKIKLKKDKNSSLLVYGGLAINGKLVGEGTVVVKSPQADNYGTEELLGNLLVSVDKANGRYITSRLRDGSIIAQADKLLSGDDKEITIYADGVVEFKQPSVIKKKDDEMMSFKDEVFALIAQNVLTALAKDPNALKSDLNLDKEDLKKLLNHWDKFDEIAGDLGLNISKEELAYKIIEEFDSSPDVFEVTEDPAAKSIVIKLKEINSEIKITFSKGASGTIYSQVSIKRSNGETRVSDKVEVKDVTWGEIQKVISGGFSGGCKNGGGGGSIGLPPNSSSSGNFLTIKVKYENNDTTTYGYMPSPPNQNSSKYKQNKFLTLIGLIVHNMKDNGSISRFNAEVDDIDNESEFLVDVLGESSTSKGINSLYEAYRNVKKEANWKKFWDYNSSADVFISSGTTSDFKTILSTKDVNLKGALVGGMIYGKVVLVDTGRQAITLRGTVVASDSLLVNTESTAKFVFDRDYVNMDLLEEVLGALKEKGVVYESYLEMLAPFKSK